MYYVHNHDLSVTTKSNLECDTVRSPETYNDTRYMYADAHVRTTHESS